MQKRSRSMDFAFSKKLMDQTRRERMIAKKLAHVRQPGENQCAKNSNIEADARSCRLVTESFKFSPEFVKFFVGLHMR